MSEQFQWKEAYSVGTPALDDQHKTLISLINELDTIEREGGGDLRDVMDKLDWYVDEHFTLEENMMADAGYEDLDAHAAKHREFCDWLKAAKTHMATVGIGHDALLKAINDHLKEWLAEHILVSDMAYKNKL